MQLGADGGVDGLHVGCNNFGQKRGLRGWFFSLLSCYWCFGVWVAGLFSLVWVVWGGLGCGAGVVVWLALSVVGAWLRMFELLVVGFID